MIGSYRSLASSPQEIENTNTPRYTPLWLAIIYHKTDFISTKTSMHLNDFLVSLRLLVAKADPI